MKNLTFTVLLAFIAIGAFAQQIAVPNGNFESWNSSTFDYPRYYESSNSEVLRNKLPFNAEKSTSAYHGSYALKLTSVANSKDSMFGYIINGSTEDEPDKWHGGAPISGTPTGIRGYYKATLTAGDTALVLVAFSKAGVNIGTYVHKIYNQASSYSLFTYNFSPALSQTPDSVVFAVVSSNPFLNKMITGTVLYIDSVSLTGIATQPPLLNGDFELWDSKTFDEPQKWYAEYGRQMPQLKTTNAYKGQFAARLETVADDHHGNPVARGGYLSTGYYPENCNPCNQIGGYPFTRMSDTLSFWYKYTPTAGGKAIVRAVLKKNGNQIWSNDVMLTATSTYTNKELPITNFGMQTPDTIIIEIQSNIWEDSTLNHVGSVLMIDEIQLKSEPLKTGILKSFSYRGARVYPNPAGDYLNINFDGTTPMPGTKLLIVNAIGQTLLAQELDAGNTEIDIRGLQKGVYFYLIESPGVKVKSGRLLIK